MDIEAFILIGGQSRRFGSDKALINLDGSSIVERIARNIEAAISPYRTRLVAANDHQFPAFSGFPSNLPLVFDLYEGRGPAGGFYTALVYAQTEWVLVLGCDFPFISAELLRMLTEYISGDFDAIAPIQSDGRIQPLCTFYRREPCLEVLAEIFENKRVAPPLHFFLDQVRTCFVGFDELAQLRNAHNFFLNLNTPSDLETARKIVSAE